MPQKVEILQSQRRVPRLNKRTISNFPVQIYRITIIFASETNENVGEHVGDFVGQLTHNRA